MCLNKKPSLLFLGFSNRLGRLKKLALMLDVRHFHSIQHHPQTKHLKIRIATPTTLRSSGHLGVVPRLKSRKRLIKCTEPINTTAKDDEHLPWTTWKALNRLRTQVGRSRVNKLKWGYSNEPETCACDIRQTMQHILVCHMMNTACSTQDLTTVNGIAIGCARNWVSTILTDLGLHGGRTRMMMIAFQFIELRSAVV